MCHHPLAHSLTCTAKSKTHSVTHSLTLSFICIVAVATAMTVAFGLLVSVQ
jgi:hypothetical protein